MPDAIQTRVSWPSLFQESVRPLFILNRARRLRFVNAAMEKLARVPGGDLLGKACVRKGPTEPLLRALAPPMELSRQTVATVRRAAPPQENGPPWWDITFIRLAGPEETSGILGIVDLIPAAEGMPLKSVDPFLAALQKKHAERFTYELFSGTSLRAERFRAQLRHAADSPAAVWLHGEPGSGKETAARVIHHHSARREMPFVKVDAPALQPYLVESLLFGTGGLARAGRIGTLFIRHPSALPRDLQAKLVTWLLTDAAPRLICSELSPATDAVAAGTLRSEFATSFSVLELTPRPLRERFDELPGIVERLLARRKIKTSNIHDDFYKTLRSHRWPGNLRELDSALSSIPEDASSISAAWLPRYLREQLLGPEVPPAAPRPSLDAILEAVEKRLLSQALAECGGNQAEAARKLGIHRARLIRRVDALGIT